MEIVFLILGIAIGFALAWFIKKSDNNQLQLQEELHVKNQNEAALQKEKEIINGQLAELGSALALSRNELQQTKIDLAKAQSEAGMLLERVTEQKAELQKLKDEMAKEFENLANRIFDEKSEKFNNQNKNTLDQVLSPLKERIKDFEEKVQKHYDEENREKASLKEQISMLHNLNQQMSNDAKNLTRALKGDTKTQGNWGEFILESILEKSGLVKDREYTIQTSFLTEDGKRFQPDVIIQLPDNKSLIIDSKVSLVAYDKFSAAEDDLLKTAAVKEHITSLRNHIKNLSEKNYQQLYDLKTLDFVLLFVPIEPAFALSVQNDAQLFNDAFEKNIVIVSPSTLLATLRTVASIWRNENQNKNAVEIARKAGDLYDKFTGFIDDMIDLGKKMDNSKNSYVEAMKKLAEGRGNLVGKVEELKKMGAKASKSIPASLIDRSNQID